MKQSVFSLLTGIIVLIALAAPALAQKAAVVGIIDTQVFLQESKVVQEKRQAFLLVLEQKRGLLRTKQVEVQKLEQELRTAGSSLSAADRGRKTESLAQEAKEFQRLREDLADETKKKNEEINRQILTELTAIVQDYRKKQKFTLILERRFVVAFDEAVDITADIIKAYDGKKR